VLFTERALAHLRPGEPTAEVTDFDIEVSRESLLEVLPILDDLFQERIDRAKLSKARRESEEELRARLEAARRSEMLWDHTPRDPELREWVVHYLRAVAAVVAAALIDFVLETMFGALGISDMVGQATVQGAEAVREVSAAVGHAALEGAAAVRGLPDQLREVLPALATPAFRGAQLGASLVLLSEASDLLKASVSAKASRTTDTSSDIPAESHNRAKKNSLGQQASPVAGKPTSSLKPEYIERIQKIWHKDGYLVDGPGVSDSRSKGKPGSGGAPRAR
jgi:hypothetical protein